MAAAAGTGTEGFRAQYEKKLAREAELAHNMGAPDIELRYSISYSLHLPPATVSRKIQTVPESFLKMALTPVTIAKKLLGKVETQELKVLDNVKGVIKPGTLTLLLSPPGHSKSSFLKALAGRISPKKLRGEIKYNGVSSREALARGVQVKQLVSYVDQLDLHLPFLTVRETFRFAHDNATADPALLDDPELRRYASEKVEDVIKLLSLSNCADTLVGDNVVRGVSGGEKRRVTIGECLVSNARVFLMDEISTGLDSAVTFDIVSSMRTWAKRTNGTVVIALLQPTPEVVDLFDDIILLREGAVVYHGPRKEVAGYFDGLGFHPPTPTPPPASHAPDSTRVGRSESTGADAASPGLALSVSSAVSDASAISRQDSAGNPAAPADVKLDLADWLVEVVTDPLAAWRKGCEQRVKEQHEAERLALEEQAAAALAEGGRPTLALHSPAPAPADPTAGAKRPPTSTAELVSAFQSSHFFSAMMSAAPSSTSLGLTHPFTRAQFGRAYPRSALSHFMNVLRRQFVLTKRNRLFITVRIFSSVFMGFVLGTVFFAQGKGNALENPNFAFSMMGLFLFAILHTAFGNFSEVPIAVESKYACYKQMASGMYPGAAYVAALTTMHLPLALVESSVFSVMIYWLCALAPDAGRFFFFTLVLWLVNIALASFFRTVAYLSPDMETAQIAPGPVISIQMLFAGFLISIDSMGWLKFMNYLSVFGWAFRSIAQNEFFDEARYGPLGTLILEAASLQTDPAWKWGGVGFIIGFGILATILAALAITYVRIERNIGTSRVKTADVDVYVETRVAPSPALVDAVGSPLTPVDAASPASPAVAVAVSPVKGSVASVLPFTPMTVTIKDIIYDVKLTKSAGGGIKRLLQGISGVFVPGTVTALMGASGAGKTTLLDAIGGRKNSGTLQGQVFLNGFPKEHKSFSRLTAYVEQQDLHNPQSTVRESLQFSAHLRLPANVTTETRNAFVEEILDLLELRGIADRKVGEPGAADGLAPSERKRLTIGVELVSNAPIIFLDEPTTSLDSRAAAVVVRVIKKIAMTGRTVITTIHQPAADLFFQFDNLLLLQRGGWQVYFGPTGRKGRALIRYMQGIPGTRPCPRRQNPASWMLDVLGGTDSSGISPRRESVASGGRRASAVKSETAETHPNPLTSVAVVAADLPPGVTMGPNDKHPGPVDYQAILRSSPEWARLQAEIANQSHPAPGSKPFRFQSVYARSFFVQFAQLMKRTWTSYYRAVDYNTTRITALCVLHVIFGIIYLDEARDMLKQPTMSPLTLNNLVSVMFMTTAFIGMLCMNTILPVAIRSRAVFYRERASFLYGSTPYAITSVLVELPWIIIVILTSVPVIYFMVGFTASASAFFYYALVCFVFAITFMSIGMAAASLLPTVDVAQAVVGMLIPILFLFGGLFLRQPDIPRGWKWLNTVDPLQYAINALVAPQFHCTPGGPCPTVTIPCSGPVCPSLTLDQYMAGALGVVYEDRWRDFGVLFAFLGFFQLLYVIGVKFVNHVKR